MNSTKNAVIVLLALTTIAGAGLAWRQHRELVELRSGGSDAGRADSQKRIADLEKANRELQNKLAAARGERPAGDLADGPTADRGERGDSSGRGRGGPGGRGAEFAAMRELMAKPEVQAMIASTRKAAVDQQYAPLLHALNLPPDQADKLKALLVEKQNTMQDVMSAAREQGVDPRADRDGLRHVVADAENAVDSSIKSLLGDDGYAKLSNYEQTMPQRNLVNALQHRLSATDAPLTPAQSEQLVQILASTTPQPASGTTPGTTAPTEGPGFGPRGGEFGGRMGGMFGGGAAVAAIAGPSSAPITNDAVAQAQTILAPPQLSALQQLQQQQQTAQQLQQMLRSSVQNATSAGTATGSAAPSSGNTGAPRTGGRRPGG